MNIHGSEYILWEAMAPGVRERMMNEDSRRIGIALERRERESLESQSTEYLENCVAMYEERDGRIGGFFGRLFGFAPSRDETDRRYDVATRLLREREQVKIEQQL